MGVPLLKRIQIRHRRRQPARETESRSRRPSRRKALVTPPTEPRTPSQAEEPTSEVLKRRERRRKRQRLSSRRPTGPRLTFLTID
jgi:hypothetical protein